MHGTNTASGWAATPSPASASATVGRTTPRLPRPKPSARPAPIYPSHGRPSVNGRQNHDSRKKAIAMLTDHARTGIPAGAALPVAPPPRHRSPRQAGQVILWLVLIGLAAAVAYVLVEVVLASADLLGPQLPWPPPHPVPAPNPAPVPPAR
jgi:hypothetical protein